MVLVLPTPMTHNEIKNKFAQLHRGTSVNVIKHSCKVPRNNVYMFGGDPTTKGYFVKAVVFKDEVRNFQDI